ncbi:aminotransferase [Mesobacterium pallidum]|uniref:aminotransferase n=1 Tax=Mesobacterium pallidum TaxID=2872037 RepID=UPI001EE37FD0|nr:aminotransferase [Mesobacterium pallidum]
MTSRTEQTFTAPVVEAFRWLAETPRPEGLPLINVSQAAPAAPPPEPLRAHMAQLVMDVPAVHLYGPDLGLPALRQAIAARFSRDYGGQIGADQVAVTAGCNQAFCAAIAAITDQGDEVILPTPWYFNHKMWLDMAGITTLPLPTGDSLLPDPEAAAALITPRTRAIVLVTPNNPGGVEYPPKLVAAFRDLARARGLKLIIDETYRDFDARSGAAHDLFTDPDWADTVIQLYSFSKAYRLTGHRTGCLVAHQDLLPEVEKFMDTVAICAPQLGQHAAVWGMENLDQWLAGERDEILARRAALAEAFTALEPLGWKLKGLGAYFAYVEHPFALPSDALCKAMLETAAILALPATFFMPEGDAEADRHLRLAFANVEAGTLKELCTRLAALGFDRRAD